MTGVQTCALPIYSNLLIKTGTKKISVSRSNISHVQALKDYAIIYCRDAKYVVRSTMKEMEELLGAAGFLRVHKSFIIAINKIESFNADSVEILKKEIPIGRLFKFNLNKILNSSAASQALSSGISYSLKKK